MGIAASVGIVVPVVLRVRYVRIPIRGINSKCVDPHSVVVILPVVSIVVVIIVLPIVATPIPLVLPIVVILEEKSTNQKITSSSIDSRLKRLTLP